ncbi:MAG: sugar transferase [Chitinophagaceae bacterium]|nr:sugar transferase [Chitinophagaceae bacterium]
MQAETYQITADAGRKWQILGSQRYALTEKKGLAFLYVGHQEESFKSTDCFQKGLIAASFEQAQTLIEDLTRNNIPDVVFVDLPLNKVEFTRFCAYLKERSAGKMVVIYNQRHLDAAKIKFLKQADVVDDILDISLDGINYSDKIQFLKRVKSRQGGLSVSYNGLMENNGPVHRKTSIVKRVIDVVLASLIILMMLPLFLLVALAVKLESRGPIFYTSNRAGRGFKVFKFYKFRTMVVGADKKIAELAHLNQYTSNGGSTMFLKINNDPRVTRVGKFLRNSSLDEIPQLFNVLKGDMSLVGNRPLPLYEAATLTTNDSAERFMAPAGITGLWQIKKRGKDDMSAEERISLDISYARKANVAYDLWIMAKTPTVLFQKSNV